MTDPCRDRAQLPGLERLALLTADAFFEPRTPGVLIADDEARLRALMAVTLRQSGFAVWKAADGQEAIETYRDHRSDIDLVVLDLGMPGPDGRETLKALRHLNPDLRCCCLAGTADYPYERDLIELGAVHIFHKPVELVVFAYMLCQLMDESGATSGVPCQILTTDEVR